MQNRIPKKLIEKIRDNELIAFVGAGISAGVKDKSGKQLFLGWNDLLLSSTKFLKDNNKDKEANFITSSIEMAETSKDYLVIADKIKQYLSSDWKEFLDSNFDKSYNDIDQKTLDIPKEIWKFGRLIITTNYDNVMRWTSEDKDLITWDKKALAGQVESLKTKPTKDTLWHLHGRIDNLDDIVLTTNSYEEVYKENSGAIEVLKAHMLTKSFIFFGFSLDDIYLREQLKKLKTIFENNAGRHYILLKENNQIDLSEYGDIEAIYIKDYEEDYLSLLKELTQCRKTEVVVNDSVTEIENLEVNNIESIETRPFNVPFRSKQKGAIGIEKKLSEIHEILETTRKTTIGQVASFQGMGGLGKTQLAVEYANNFKEHYSGGVVWLTIDKDINEQLLELAEKCYWIKNDTDAKIKLEIAKKRFANLSNALIIFDNVDNIKEIEELFVKSTTNKTLITSRNDIQGFKTIPLELLDKSNSLKLLVYESNRNIEDKELDSVNRLVTLLGGLPLALEMAGAYVGHYKYTWNEYLDFFEEGSISFLEESEIRGFTEHTTNIAKTLSLSDSLIDKTKFLKEVVYLLAWGANEAIEKKLLAILLDEKELAIIKEIQIGINLKFIQKSEDGYTIHRLVREILQKKEPLNKILAERISRNLVTYMKNIKDEFLELRELDKASIQAKVWAENIDENSLKVQLISYSAYPDYHRGNYKVALEDIEYAFKLFKDGSNPDVNAEILTYKAFLLQALGNAKEAKPYHIKALEMTERLYEGSDHSDMANSLNNMGGILNILGDSKEAKLYYIKALEMRERLSAGGDYPGMATALNNMGSILDTLGDSKEAKPYYIKALEMRERLYEGSDHPDIADSLNNMGFILDILGDSKEAKPYNIKALEMRERLYESSDHPGMANALNNMGTILNTLGDSKEAKPYYIKALEMRERLYESSDHPDIADSLNNMGTILNTLGDPKEAKKYYKRAFEMGKRKQGKENPDTIRYMFNYVTLHSRDRKTKSQAISILTKFKKEFKKNKTLVKKVNTVLNQIKES
ncbi:MAG: hypothetical protein COA30_01075 [Sulfurimonas sp.]|nr:MAG: hypothetical protein COA30_01075 [Sulfurimonas sp.]